MIDAGLLFVGGALAVGAILTEDHWLTRLAVALSYGFMVGVYFGAVVDLYDDLPDSDGLNVLD